MENDPSNASNGIKSKLMISVEDWDSKNRRNLRL